MLCNLKLRAPKTTAFAVKERAPAVDSPEEQKTNGSKVLILGGTGRVGGSTDVELSNLRPDLCLFIGGRNREKDNALASKIGKESKFVEVDIDDMESLGAALNG